MPWPWLWRPTTRKDQISQPRQKTKSLENQAQKLDLCFVGNENHQCFMRREDVRSKQYFKLEYVLHDGQGEKRKGFLELSILLALARRPTAMIGE